jgi:predicted TIM-barrel fold metal-dependent hydrolase
VVHTQRVLDIHVHVQPWQMLKPQVLSLWKRHHPDFERLLRLADQPNEFLKLMDQEGLERAALINYVSPDVMGFTEGVNEFVAQYCQTAPDRLIPVGSLHPQHLQDPKAKMAYLIETLGIRMIKIHPPHQLFYPNDYLNGMDALAIIYEQAQDHGIPVMFHTGTSIFPAARVKYGDPIHLDDVAIDFPRLKIILAHGGRPLWMNTAFFLLRRHPNIYLDISGIPPQSLLSYFPRLEEIAHKTMFGSDWPGPAVRSIRANIESFMKLPLPVEIQRAILHDTAEKLLSSP